MKVAIVSGASSGIGKATLNLLSKSGYTTVGFSRHMEPTIDVRDKYQVNKLVKSTAETFGRIDVLINNAGYAHKKLPFESISRTDLLNSFETNTFGPFYMMRAALPVMKRRNSGFIINISSMAAVSKPTGFTAYTASKIALIAMTETLAKELADTNIICVAICPGATDTPMRELTDKKESARKFQSPHVIANIILDIVQKKKVNGIKVTSGMVFSVTDGVAKRENL